MNDDNLLRNYDNIQKIKNGGTIKISIKGLTKILGCSPQNRMVCGKLSKNACCIHHSKEHHTRFHPDEVHSLPDNIKQLLNPDGTLKVIPESGHCVLIENCILHPDQKPSSCALAPLGFNSAGRLIIKRMAWTKPCPFYGKGDPIYISMKDCLIAVFGETAYNNICKMIESGIEEYSQEQE